jgi:hypothetical protein
MPNVRCQMADGRHAHIYTYILYTEPVAWLASGKAWPGISDLRCGFGRSVVCIAILAAGHDAHDRAYFVVTEHVKCQCESRPTKQHLATTTTSRSPGHGACPLAFPRTSASAVHLHLVSRQCDTAMLRAASGSASAAAMWQLIATCCRDLLHAARCTLHTTRNKEATLAAADRNHCRRRSSLGP